MYAATMSYHVVDGAMDDFVAIWDEKVLQIAKKQPGFVMMQLLVREGEALAQGTWESKKHAEAFMALGPFKELMGAITGLLTDQPVPLVYERALFAER